MQENEILIIGGGIAGTSTAYHLSKYGHAVTLLERNELATEASGLNAGGIVSESSLEIFKTLQFDHGCDIEFRQCGNLKAIQTEEQDAFARQEALELTSQGQKVEILTARDARSIEPALSKDILGCMYYPHAGMADPVKTTYALAELAQRQGATILTNHEVTDIQAFDDGTYQIVTQQEMFKAKLLVLAAGPWCGALGSMLNLHIPVYTVRGQMWSTGPVPTRIFHFESLYLLSGLCSSGFSDGPMAGKLLADYIHTGTVSPMLSAADPAQHVTFAN